MKIYILTFFNFCKIFYNQTNLFLDLKQGYDLEFDQRLQKYIKNKILFFMADKLIIYFMDDIKFKFFRLVIKKTSRS